MKVAGPLAFARVGVGAPSPAGGYPRPRSRPPPVALGAWDAGGCGGCACHALPWARRASRRVCKRTSCLGASRRCAFYAQPSFVAPDLQLVAEDLTATAA